MHENFNLKRILLLLRKNIAEHCRPHIVIFAAFWGWMLLMSVLYLVFNDRASINYDTYFGIILFVWGIIAASFSLRELHDKNQNIEFLLLPASAAEKILARLLMISLFLPLLLLAMATITSLLSESIMALIFSLDFRPFNPFTTKIWKSMGDLVICQSVFFLGAAWFRKRHLAKTLLSLLLLVLILTLVSGILLRIVFSSYFGSPDSWFPSPLLDFFLAQDQDMEGYQNMADWVGRVGKIIFYYFLAPFCWFTAWLRVKETQVNEGV